MCSEEGDEEEESGSSVMSDDQAELDFNLEEDEDEADPRSSVVPPTSSAVSTLDAVRIGRLSDYLGDSLTLGRRFTLPVSDLRSPGVSGPGSASGISSVGNMRLTSSWEGTGDWAALDRSPRTQGPKARSARFAPASSYSSVRCAENA